MLDQKIEYTPIGTIRTPHKEIKGMPIQTANARGVRGILEVGEAYAVGLDDLTGFSHIIALYHFHRVAKPNLKPVPYLDGSPHGLFSTRAPARVNPIGISILKLVSVEKNAVTVEDVDILDGTPLLDIKPYVPQFDSIPDASTGWYRERLKDLPLTKADERFARP
jgi:tRNA (adenine37-N6)-methyltransferase